MGPFSKHGPSCPAWLLSCFSCLSSLSPYSLSGLSLCQEGRNRGDRVTETEQGPPGGPTAGDFLLQNPCRLQLLDGITFLESFSRLHVESPQRWLGPFLYHCSFCDRTPESSSHLRIPMIRLKTKQNKQTTTPTSWSLGASHLHRPFGCTRKHTFTCPEVGMQVSLGTTMRLPKGHNQTSMRHDQFQYCIIFQGFDYSFQILLISLLIFSPS